MVSVIELPNGSRAMFSDAGWYCMDAAAIPMLNYFQGKITRYCRNPIHDIAQLVAASIAGAKFIFYSPYVADREIDEEKRSRGWIVA